MATHAGAWEVTPLRGQIEDLLDFLITQSPWVLMPLD
jgi:hypothetical protein